MNEFSEFIIIATTLPNNVIGEEKSELISKIILENKLAACIQKNLVNSSFVWQNKIENCQEISMKIKTRKTNFEKVAKIIKKNHCYKIAEIVAIPIINFSKEYFSWLESNIPKQ